MKFQLTRKNRLQGAVLQTVVRELLVAYDGPIDGPYNYIVLTILYDM
jgi:hypothetical protein